MKKERSDRRLLDFNYLKVYNVFDPDSCTKIYRVVVRNQWWQRWRLVYNTCYVDLLQEYLKNKL